MIKILKTLCAICLLAGTLTACGPEQSTPPTAPPSTSKLSVVVSFNAMKELAQAVGGDAVEIHSIVPDGVEPHEFEPKATDLTALKNARVFILNGLDLEHSWSDKTIQAAGNSNLMVITASDGTQAITSTEQGLFRHQNHRAQRDPHIWLSLDGAAIESRNIRDAFIQADPDHADTYRKNYDVFAVSLHQLHDEYATKFSQSPRKDFVTGHAAFSYTAREFGLTQHGLESVFSSGEPSARRLKELADYSKTHHIYTIFIENMENPKIAQTLANEVGAVVEDLNTLESSEGDTHYIDTMRENLEKIYQSLQ